jgi:hypothetical protein
MLATRHLISLSVAPFNALRLTTRIWMVKVPSRGIVVPGIMGSQKIHTASIHSPSRPLIRAHTFRAGGASFMLQSSVECMQALLCQPLKILVQGKEKGEEYIPPFLTGLWRNVDWLWLSQASGSCGLRSGYLSLVFGGRTGYHTVRPCTHAVCGPRYASDALKGRLPRKVISHAVVHRPS